jgi:CRISPR-associated exonuclease Cas4
MKTDISGTMYSYYFLCNRKLWFYSHELLMEQNSELIQIGKNIDENSYNSQEKSIKIDDLAVIDYLKSNTICEVKKSDSESQMAKNQILYYLYLLNLKGIKYSGEIHYPLLKKITKVILESQDIKNIEKNLEAINIIIKNQIPPKESFLKACKNCSYYELCKI